jgi:DNA-directed RNA polymerase sigma subunit (sigma70/sigma32)
VGIEKQRAQLLLSQGGVVSMDQQDDDGLSIGDRLSSETKGSHPDDIAFTREALTRVEAIFDDLLDEREKYILTHHYGLRGEDSRTMADIGKSMGLSRERVRQIEVGALVRLRHSI